MLQFRSSKLSLAVVFAAAFTLTTAFSATFPVSAYAARGGGGHGGGGGGFHGGGGGFHGGGGGFHGAAIGGGARPSFAGRSFASPSMSRPSISRPSVSRSSFTARSSGRSFSSRQNFRGNQSFANRSGSRGASRSARINSARTARINNTTRSANISGRNVTRRNAAAAAIAGALATHTLNGRALNNAAATRNAGLVRNALVSRPVSQALRTPGALRNPAARAFVTTRLATAGWRGGNRGWWWWRHRNGGFGWVGPVFWPFAYYDFYNYAFWGDSYDPSFWGYGYPDLYAGMFSPYGYDDLSGYSDYLPQGGGGVNSYAAAPPASRSASRSGSGTTPNDETSLVQMCGNDSREIAGLPIDDFAKAIGPGDAQHAALEDLANASVTAAQKIRSACPTTAALTAPGRLAAMQQRIEAMVAAVQTVQPPLDKFYSLLDDEQKAKVAGLANSQLANSQHATQTAETTGSVSSKTSSGPAANDSNTNSGAATSGTATTAASNPRTCGGAQPGVTEWPNAAIESNVKPNDAQRQKLEALQSAAAKAADMLKTSCEPQNLLTPPARLAAVGNRLDTMLQAIKTIRPAMDEFYGSLSDEQKANFDAIGPQRVKTSDQSLDEPADQRSTHHRRYAHHDVNIRQIRRMIYSFVRW
jgi:hypothetical protein